MSRSCRQTRSVMRIGCRHRRAEVEQCCDLHVVGGSEAGEWVT